MSNIPKDAREFNLDMAQRGHPIVTRDGREAKFIAYVPEAHACGRLVALIDKSVNSFHDNGSWRGRVDVLDLFLAPLGMCEGKSVFAGDVLVSCAGEFTVQVGIKYTFVNCKWPVSKAVVKTRMTDEELYAGDSPKAVANKAIERAIADGDVIPTSVVKELKTKAYNQCVNLNASYKENFDVVLKEYLESLK